MFFFQIFQFFSKILSRKKNFFGLFGPYVFRILNQTWKEESKNFPGEKQPKNKNGLFWTGKGRPNLFSYK